MHIAIDDTYGPVDATASIYVTGARRTHVAVVFMDEEVDHVREEVGKCLDYLSSFLPSRPAEFHFADIYNRRGVWAHLKEGANVGIVNFFAVIYHTYRWRVFLQTVDERTIADHPDLLTARSLDGLDPTKMADLSLEMLCIQLRIAYKQTKPPIRLLLDQGRCAPGTPFGSETFADWGTKYSGEYASSSAEPLLQIADFLAFSINRSTHLCMKEKRTETDNNFIDLVNGMEIDCTHIEHLTTRKDFTVEDFDAAHYEDRRRKGLDDDVSPPDVD